MSTQSIPTGTRVQGRDITTYLTVIGPVVDCTVDGVLADGTSRSHRITIEDENTGRRSILWTGTERIFPTN